MNVRRNRRSRWSISLAVYSLLFLADVKAVDPDYEALDGPAVSLEDVIKDVRDEGSLHHRTGEPVRWRGARCVLRHHSFRDRRKEFGGSPSQGELDAVTGNNRFQQGELKKVHSAGLFGIEDLVPSGDLIGQRVQKRLDVSFDSDGLD